MSIVISGGGGTWRGVRGEDRLPGRQNNAGNRSDADPFRAVCIPSKQQNAMFFCCFFKAYHIDIDIFRYIYIHVYIPGSSRYVKFQPFGRFFWVKTHKFYTLGRSRYIQTYLSFV